MTASWKNSAQAKSLKSMVAEGRRAFQAKEQRSKKQHDEFGEPQVFYCCQDVKFVSGDEISLQTQTYSWRALYLMLRS